MIQNQNVIDLGLDTSDATATASNIDSGKTAYVNGEKVTGTSTKVDTSDATATAAEISSGKTAYVNGNKVTGTSTAKEVKSITYSSWNGSFDNIKEGLQTAYGAGGAVHSLTIAPGATFYVIYQATGIKVKLNY